MADTPPAQPSIIPPDPPQPAMSPEEAQRLGAEFRAHLIRQQTQLKGVLMAALAALVSMILWVVVTATTKFQIGWMAVGIGFLVGICISHFGKNVETKYAVVGAIFAVLACVFGNIFAQCALAAEHEHVPFLGVLSHLTPSLATEILKEGFSPMDLLFYGLAIWAGYKYAFRGVTTAEFEAFRASRA